MKARHRILALAALALGPTACGRGCTCFEGEKTYEKVHGKYELSLVRKTRWTGGKIPGPVTSFHIHITTTPPIDEPIGDCTHVDMKEEKDGKFVGYRCQDSHEKEWTVLRLRGGDRYLRECKATVGTGDTPEWGKLESVRASTSRILACEHLDSDDTMRELAHAVMEDEGSPVAADYVMTLGSLGEASSPDPWDAALYILDAPGQAAVLSKLCPSLTRIDGKADAAIYVRAARHCALDATGALPMLRSLLAEKKPAGSSTNALFWSGLLAAKANPKEAGAALCQAATEGLMVDGKRDETREAIVAELLGETHTKCPAAVAAWMKAPPCDSWLDCDGGRLCDAPELATDVSGWDSDLDGGRRGDPLVPNRGRAILRASYAAGPLPTELTIPNQRRNYDKPDAEGLSFCNDTKLDAGAPCETSILPLEVCSVPANKTVLEQSDCIVPIDDAHHRYGTPRRACELLGEKCSRHSCCGDALCRDGVCIAPPVPDAAARD